MLTIENSQIDEMPDIFDLDKGPHDPSIFIGHSYFEYGTEDYLKHLMMYEGSIELSEDMLIEKINLTPESSVFFYKQRSDIYAAYGSKEDQYKLTALTHRNYRADGKQTRIIGIDLEYFEGEPTAAAIIFRICEMLSLPSTHRSMFALKDKLGKARFMFIFAGMERVQNEDELRSLAASFAAHTLDGLFLFWNK